MMMNFFVLLWKFYFFYIFGVKVRRLSDKHLKGGRGEIHFWQTTFLKKKLKVKKKKKSSLWKERKKVVCLKTKVCVAFILWKVF